MKLLAKKEVRTNMNPHERLVSAFERAAKADPNFIDAAVSKAVEELNDNTAQKPTKDAELLCTINRDHLIDALGEALYYKMLACACELRTKAAELRYETAMKHFWQKVCDFHDLDDEEPMRLDPINLFRVLRGHNQSKLEVFRDQVLAIFEADDKELERFIEEHQRSSFQAHLAMELQGERRHREKVIELGKALFLTNDLDFLSEVAESEYVPRPLRATASIIMNEKNNLEFIFDRRLK